MDRVKAETKNRVNSCGSLVRSTKISLGEDSTYLHGDWTYLDGLAAKLSTRYVSAFCDGGPEKGETDIVMKTKDNGAIRYYLTLLEM